MQFICTAYTDSLWLASPVGSRLDIEILKITINISFNYFYQNIIPKFWYAKHVFSKEQKVVTSIIWIFRTQNIANSIIDSINSHIILLLLFYVSATAFSLPICINKFFRDT